LHGDAEQAPEAAVQLSDALRTLDDAERERLLAGALAARYRSSPAAWRLSLADARTRLATGDAARAAKILTDLGAAGDGHAEIELWRGKAEEALGHVEAAQEAYARSGRAEALARAAWLGRSAYALPSTLFLLPGDPAVVPAELPAGTELTVTAIRVNLESVLLRDGGDLDAGSVAVDGLRPAASRTLRVDATGDVPLPALPDGAYLVTVSGGSQSQRMVLVRTDAELSLTPGGGGTLVHLADHRGDAIEGAQLWVFGPDGTATTGRTDRLGAAWLDRSGAVLARLGDRYAYAGGTPAPTYPEPAPIDWDESSDLLRKNERAYGQLFEQDARQKVQAAAL
jgi:hypothetical protein